MTSENTTHQLLVNLLALDRLFQDYEFIHCYIGPAQYKNQAKKIPPEQALKDLEKLSNNLSEIPNVYPFYRRTFIKEMLSSAIEQAHFFCKGKKVRSFKDQVQTLLGAKVVPPFNLDDELEKTKKYIKKAGYNSISQFMKNRPKIKFNNINEIQRYTYNYIDQITAIMNASYSKVMPIPPKELMSNAKLVVEEACIPNLPCYYFYKGNGNGVAGVTLKKEMSETYLKGFILHEIMPGHHFYYLMKQHYIDNKCNIDHIHYIDPFYSPENTVNEGLAVNGEEILFDSLDKETLAGVKLEKFVHKILYNAWHSVNIKKDNSLKDIQHLLQNKIGFTKESSAQKLDYYTNLEKYYVASYPIGTDHVQKIIQQIGHNNLHMLYTQHSVSTLNLLTRGNLKCKTQIDCR